MSIIAVSTLYIVQGDLTAASYIVTMLIGNDISICIVASSHHNTPQY